MHAEPVTAPVGVKGVTRALHTPPCIGSQPSGEPGRESASSCAPHCEKGQARLHDRLCIAEERRCPLGVSIQPRHLRTHSGRLSCRRLPRRPRRRERPTDGSVLRRLRSHRPLPFTRRCALCSASGDDLRRGRKGLICSRRSGVETRWMTGQISSSPVNEQHRHGLVEDRADAPEHRHAVRLWL